MVISRLPTPPSLVSALRKSLPTFGKIEWVMATASTNTDLLAGEYASIPPKPWLLGAHLQRAGRGRAGRVWQNRPGAALMFSCAFDTQLPTARLPVLSPLAGLAACEALRDTAGLACDRLRLKWPNDILWNDAKLAGVLVETRRNLGPPSFCHTVVMGIGINLYDHAHLSHQLGRPIADWRQLNVTPPFPDLGDNVEDDLDNNLAATLGINLVTQLVTSIARSWQKILIDVNQHGFAAFIERFRRLDALLGRKVQVIDQGIIRHQGIAQGVDEHARLIVHTATRPVFVSVGDISVQPDVETASLGPCSYT